VAQIGRPVTDHAVVPTHESRASDYSHLLRTVQALGLLQRRHRFYAIKITILVLALAGVWVAFALIGDSWLQAGVAAGLGIVLTQLVFLSHDAAHRQIFHSGKANEWTALIIGTGLCGISLAWWNSKHSKHHATPNQVAKDPDIDPSVVHFYPAERLPRNRFLLAAHQRQGWWFYPLLVVEALNLHTQSIVALITRPELKRRRTELALLVARLAVVPALAFVFLSPGIAGAFIGIQFAVTGVYLGASFAVSHIGMPVIGPDVRIDFMRRQVLTSRNIRGGRAASAAMGGLNYQIEHHLFPSMPRPNLRYARAVVQTHCQDKGLVYNEVPIHRAWVIVIRYLNQVGLAGRNAVACPTSAALR
jgi:fatty acid desaturase